MSQNLVNKADQPIRCIGCGKVIGKGYVLEGSIQLQCKCGVKTKIEAEKKPAGQSSMSKAYDVLGFELARRMNCAKRI